MMNKANTASVVASGTIISLLFVLIIGSALHGNCDALYEKEFETVFVAWVGGLVVTAIVNLVIWADAR